MARVPILPEIDSTTKDLIKLREDLAIIPKGLVVSGELDSEESQLGLDDEKESKGDTSLDLTSSSLLSSPSNLMNGSTRPKAKVLTWLENMILIISEVGSSSLGSRVVVWYRYQSIDETMRRRGKLVGVKNTVNKR